PPDRDRRAPHAPRAPVAARRPAAPRGPRRRCGLTGVMAVNTSRAGAPGTAWRDSLLRKAARGRVELPLRTQERSRGQQYRHMAKIAAIVALAVAACLAALLVTVFVASSRSGSAA